MQRCNVTEILHQREGAGKGLCYHREKEGYKFKADTLFR